MPWAGLSKDFLPRSLFLVCLLGCLVRFAVLPFTLAGVLAPGRHHWEFGYEIGQIAASLAAGHGFSDPLWTHGQPTAVLTPVYPCLLAAIFLVFGVFSKASALVYLMFNCVVSAATAIPVYFIALRCFGPRTAVLAAWAWAFFPNAINFSAASVWYHPAVALELACLVLLALRLGAPSHGQNKPPSLRAWAVFGVLAGFAALTSPTVLGVLPFVYTWLVYGERVDRRRRVAGSLLSLVCLLLMVLPWSIRNARTFHQFIALKDGFWLEVCVGNVGNGLHWWNGEQHPAGSSVELASLHRLGELPYMALKHTEALAYIHAHPGVYGVRSLRRVLFWWTGFWSVNPEYLREEPLDGPNILFLTALTTLAGAGLYRARCSPVKRRNILLLVLVLAVYPAPFYLSHVDPGYRHGIEPLLIVLASYAVVDWRDRRRLSSDIP